MGWFHEDYMTRILRKYINSIHPTTKYDFHRGEDVRSFSFRGDGEGDFEEYDVSDATPELVKNYIQYCENQIHYANEYLRLKHDTE